MPWIVKNLWLIPALPMLAAGLSALAPQRCRKFSATLAIGSMVVAFLLSLCAFAHTLKFGSDMCQVANFRWFQFGDSRVKLGWVLDPLTAVMLVMVTFVGLLIFIYSIGYMAHDENFTRFFTFLSLFAGAMLGVVIANSLLLLFICWELVGLTSYLLIGFWYHKPSAAAAAKKAFITTRIGDLGLLLGMLWLYSQTGTLLFYDHGAGCLEQSALAKLVAQTTNIGMAVSTGIGLLIFLGAMGKSGQVPLHVWLPDAMEGPTPVSALIHAATMVAAGVFLVARVYPLMSVTEADARAQTSFTHGIVSREVKTLTPALSLSARERENRRQSNLQSGHGDLSGAIEKSEGRTTVLPLPGGEGRGEGEHSKTHSSKVHSATALKVITWVGVITAVFAALIAVAQTDIKRILAYSTVSQLGYMMMGLGVGGVAVGMFHLITHAFFKALLFMGAGSVIHGCHDEQDIRRMGELKKFMPVTFATYAIGMMALSGVPVFFSGFWSKDEILHAAHAWNISHWPFYLGLFGALLTAFYMTRQVCYVFFGKNRSAAVPSRSTPEAAKSHDTFHAPQASDHAAAQESRAPHESPPVMTIPLIVLAVFSIVLGLIGTPAWPWFQSFLGDEQLELDFALLTQPEILWTMLLSTLVVVAGIGVAWTLYGRKPIASAEAPDPLELIKPDWFAVLRDKFYIDELYEASVIKLNAWWSWVSDWFDRVIWDTAVQLVSYLVIGLSWLNRMIDEYVVNLGFDQGCEQITRGGKMMSRLQDGKVQNYLRVIGVALVVLALALIWGCQR